MLHELRELEARVLKLDRLIQGLSLAKTVLPAIHKPGWANHAEIFAADGRLDAMERKLDELSEIMCQLTGPLEPRVMPHGNRQTVVRPGTTQMQPIANL